MTLMSFVNYKFYEKIIPLICNNLKLRVNKNINRINTIFLIFEIKSKSLKRKFNGKNMSCH